MTNQTVAPDKTRNSKRGIALVLIAFVISSGWGLFEYRRANNLGDALASANSQNAHLQQQIAKQTQDLATVNAKLSDLARKNLPIAVIFRPSQSGNGLTTFFKNNAPSPMEISVLLSNPITERRREVNLNLPANGVQSIGEAEGWVFAPGHHIQVTHAQFGTVDYVVPAK